jgi:hypothetical protein
LPLRGLGLLVEIVYIEMESIVYLELDNIFIDGQQRGVLWVERAL